MVVDGYVVKKVNNYTVSGIQYNYGAHEPDYEEDSDISPIKSRKKPKGPQKALNAEQKRKLMEAEGVKAHNTSVKSHDTERDLQRKVFFKTHLDIFKVFLEKKKIREVRCSEERSDELRTS
ncbi:hypothetical protein TL16_g03667 [Triparma laevis f. inornata]|uniref:Uncharacterized protein n=1 Tax=Triparma laevis f. inornata TaxID=1714386 RepID=A0A9W7E5J5_9STRA|nr:hypothetical protein TL16_g03667 [Triparma laevis f. inornata]